MALSADDEKSVGMMSVFMAKSYEGIWNLTRLWRDEIGKPSMLNVPCSSKLHPAQGRDKFQIPVWILCLHESHCKKIWHNYNHNRQLPVKKTVYCIAI